MLRCFRCCCPGREIRRSPRRTASKLEPREESSDVLENQFIKACERGALEILEAAAAKANGSVKRVVMTSTTGAILPLSVVYGQERDSVRVWHPEDRNQPPPPPYGSELEAYIAGRKKALLASEAFIRDQKPSFDLINIDSTVHLVS